jgi:chromate transporter
MLISRGALILIAAFAVMIAIFAIVSPELITLALLMLKIDLFAFGGGFGSLPLMYHEVVDVRQWMDGKTFMDGIALGQATPGPIVITATFVGYLVHGLPGAIAATIAIFSPSFLILIITAPFFERLKSSPMFQGAMQGILASFAGLLFYVMLKFAYEIPWDWIRVLMWLTALAALMKKTDILYIVMIGAVISIIVL